MIQQCNKNQQNAPFLYKCINLIIMSSTCFDHHIVHPQEDFCMQFYGIFFTYTYRQSGRWQVVHDTGCTKEIPQNCMYKPT